MSDTASDTSALTSSMQRWIRALGSEAIGSVCWLRTGTMAVSS
ncbi:MAG: hypothetical protein AB8E87_05830 [Prochlorococcus sp.]